MRSAAAPVGGRACCGKLFESIHFCSCIIFCSLFSRGPRRVASVRLRDSSTPVLHPEASGTNILFLCDEMLLCKNRYIMQGAWRLPVAGGKATWHHAPS